ncbi:hypothetical protein GCM10023166_12280 [Paeniglutamicibacter cryotolerans]
MQCEGGLGIAGRTGLLAADLQKPAQAGIFSAKIGQLPVWKQALITQWQFRLRGRGLWLGHKTHCA